MANIKGNKGAAVIFNHNLLFKLMQNEDVNVNQLTKKLGFVPGHLSRLRAGKHLAPSPDIIFRLSKYFNITIEDFLIKNPDYNGMYEVRIEEYKQNEKELSLKQRVERIENQMNLS